jgi:undecaprenyl-diphosphatase
MSFIGRIDDVFNAKIQRLPRSLKPLMQAATLCGSTVPIFITLGLQYGLGQKATKRAVMFIAVAIVLDVGLKQYIHRPRPDTLYVALKRFRTHSFPSGHTFGAITAYGFTAYQSLIHVHSPWNIIAAIIIAALIFLIGVSRVYLGAHYPSDVIGGWALGAVCLAVAIAIS